MKSKYEKPLAINVRGSTADGSGLDACVNGSIATGIWGGDACTGGYHASGKDCVDGGIAAGGACTPGSAVYSCVQGKSAAAYACDPTGGGA